MPATATIDLSAIPEAQREAVAAVLRERDALKEANKRLEHLVAELNHAVQSLRHLDALGQIHRVDQGGCPF